MRREIKLKALKSLFFVYLLVICQPLWADPCPQLDFAPDLTWEDVLNPQISVDNFPSGPVLVHSFELQKSSKLPEYDPHGSLEKYFDPAKSINLGTEPERLSEKAIISASLISPSRPQTFHAVGFVLRSPRKNMIAANHKDTGHDFIRATVEPDEAIRFLQTTFGLPAPNVILAKTQEEGLFNEAFLYGSTPYGKTEAIALFLETDHSKRTILEYGQPWQREMILSISKSLSIPIVRGPRVWKLRTGP